MRKRTEAKTTSAEIMTEGVSGLNLAAATIEASQCDACHRIFYPSRNYCSDCGARSRVASHVVSAKGRVYSFSKIHAGKGAFGDQYTVAYVDLDSGPRVFGHLSPSHTVRIDDSVIGNWHTFVDQVTGEPFEVLVFRLIDTESEV